MDPSTWIDQATARDFDISFDTDDPLGMMVAAYDAASFTRSEINEMLMDSESLAYQGFDLKTIHKAFWAKANQLYNLIGEPTNMAKVDADLKTFLLFACVRSNNVDKLEDLSMERRTMLAELFRKWGITKGRRAGDRACLTLPRICALYIDRYLMIFLAKEAYKQFGIVDGLELIYHNSMAPSFIPRNDQGKEQMKKWLAWASNFHKSINSGKSQAERDTLWTRTVSICRAQFETGFPESRRLDINAKAVVYALTHKAGVIKDEQIIMLREDLAAETLRSFKMEQQTQIMKAAQPRPGLFARVKRLLGYTEEERSITVVMEEAALELEQHKDITDDPITQSMEEIERIMKNVRKGSETAATPTDKVFYRGFFIEREGAPDHELQREAVINTLRWEAQKRKIKEGEQTGFIYAEGVEERGATQAATASQRGSSRKRGGSQK